MSYTETDEDYIQNLLTAVKCLAKRAACERRKKEVCQKQIDELMGDLEVAVKSIEYYEATLQMQDAFVFWKNGVVEGTGGAVCSFGGDLFNNQRIKLTEH